MSFRPGPTDLLVPVSWQDAQFDLKSEPPLAMSPVSSFAAPAAPASSSCANAADGIAITKKASKTSKKLLPDMKLDRQGDLRKEEKFLQIEFIIHNTLFLVPQN